MTAPIHIPERVAQLANALHQDRARQIAAEREEQEALAAASATEADANASERRLAELLHETEQLRQTIPGKWRLVEVERQTAAARKAEQEHLAREIEAGEAMLAGAEQLLGYTLPSVPEPPAWPPAPVTPPQGVPVVRVAEPFDLSVDVDTVVCRWCHGTIHYVSEGGWWLHSDTNEPECPTATADAAHSEQDGSADL